MKFDLIDVAIAFCMALIVGRGAAAMVRAIPCPWDCFLCWLVMATVMCGTLVALERQR